MRSFILVSLSLVSLVVGSLSNDKVESWKIPTVVGLLDKVLTDFGNDGFSIPEINLGEDVGRISDIRAEASGKFEHVIKPVKTYGFDLKLSAENITVNGFYDIKNIDLPELFPIFGKGDLRVELQDLDLAIRLEVTTNLTTQKFNTKITNFDLSLEKSIVKLDNLMNDPSLADFLNELLSSLIPDLVQVLHKGLVPILEPLFGNVMNKVIDCIRTEAVTGKLEECIKNITRVGYDLPEILHFPPAIVTSLN